MPRRHILHHNRICSVFHTHTPQVDFHGGGSLAVPGADEDARRIQSFVEKHLDDITSIFVTLDSHQVRLYMYVCMCPAHARLRSVRHTHIYIYIYIYIQRVHISHPLFWKDATTGAAPPPFTPIPHADVASKTKWVAADPALQEYAEEYTKKLEEGATAGSSKFQHIIWPEHCLIGSPGHCVVGPVLDGECVSVYVWLSLCHCLIHLLDPPSLLSIFLYTNNTQPSTCGLPTPANPSATIGKAPTSSRKCTASSRPKCRSRTPPRQT